jgi:hypothetical protein
VQRKLTFDILRRLRLPRRAFEDEQASAPHQANP